MSSAKLSDLVKFEATTVLYVMPEPAPSTTGHTLKNRLPEHAQRLNENDKKLMMSALSHPNPNQQSASDTRPESVPRILELYQGSRENGEFLGKIVILPSHNITDVRRSISNVCITCMYRIEI